MSQKKLSKVLRFISGKTFIETMIGASDNITLRGVDQRLAGCAKCV